MEQRYLIDEHGNITLCSVIVRCTECIRRGNVEECLLQQLQQKQMLPFGCWTITAIGFVLMENVNRRINDND